MGKRILVVDDNPAIAKSLMIRLDAMGYESIYALNGMTGLKMIKEESPDLVVLDIRMPDIDGLEVNRRLKADPELAQIPVIFLSANIKESTRREAMEAGAKHYFSKPYNPGDLMQAIGQLTAA